ncbi:MAG: hypothetical protein HY690_05850 [Chloroflexi bacterium]|nr:hypothetical protein [Chloroflexota bacterium]
MHRVNYVPVSVVLTFDDGNQLVLYQDPRRAGVNVQTVHIRHGAFDRAEVTGLVSRELIIRFEHDDRQECEIVCPDLQLAPRKPPPGSATDVLIQC